MFAKSALLCALLTASAQLALAQPSCLLAAVNKFEHPADQKTLCCTSASQVKSYIGDLCSAGSKSDALSAFKTACEQAGYGSCSSSSSSSSSASGSKTATATGTSSGSSGYASAFGSAVPYPIVYTSTYFDHVCSCTKTAAFSSTGVAGSTGFATGTAPVVTGTAGSGSGSGSGSGAGTGSGAGAAGTGSPIAPVAPSKTGAAGAAGFTGAATKNIGSVAARLLAVAGIAVAL